MQYEESGLLKIAVADDHALFREALCGMIDTWENCKVTIRAENGRQLLDRINPKNPPEIVLTDLQMPEMNGYETARVLSEKYKEVKILVISQYHSEEMLLQLIRCGVHGFVYKNDDPTRLKRALLAILKEGFFFTDHSATKLIKNAIHGGQVSIKNELSSEEFDFLHLICSDKSYKEIAFEMKIPERHVEYIRNSLFDRFDVKTRTGLAIAALQKGLSHWPTEFRNSTR